MDSLVGEADDGGEVEGDEALAVSLEEVEEALVAFHLGQLAGTTGRPLC